MEWLWQGNAKYFSRGSTQELDGPGREDIVLKGWWWVSIQLHLRIPPDVPCGDSDGASGGASWGRASGNGRGASRGKGASPPHRTHPPPIVTGNAANWAASWDRVRGNRQGATRDRGASPLHQSVPPSSLTTPPAGAPLMSCQALIGRWRQEKRRPMERGRQGNLSCAAGDKTNWRPGTTSRSRPDKQRQRCVWGEGWTRPWQ